MGRGLVVGLGALLLAGCGGNDVGKYDQTWRQEYSATSCGEFANSMTEHERFAMAADMIGSTANSRNGTTDLPPDDLVDEVIGQMSTACEGDDSVAMTDVAVGLFMLDSSLYTY